jgi:phospholipase D-like protein
VNSLILFAQAEDWWVGGFLGGLLSVMAVVWILALAATIFWLWMLIDVLISKRETNEKILWFLVVFFLHFLGALIYFCVARQRAGSVAGTAT